MEDIQHKKKRVLAFVSPDFFVLSVYALYKSPLEGTPFQQLVSKKILFQKHPINLTCLTFEISGTHDPSTNSAQPARIRLRSQPGGVFLDRTDWKLEKILVHRSPKPTAKVAKASENGC